MPFWTRLVFVAGHLSDAFIWWLATTLSFCFVLYRKLTSTPYVNQKYPRLIHINLLPLRTMARISQHLGIKVLVKSKWQLPEFLCYHLGTFSIIPPTLTSANSALIHADFLSSVEMKLSLIGCLIPEVIGPRSAPSSRVKLHTCTCSHSQAPWLLPTTLPGLHW